MGGGYREILHRCGGVAGSFESVGCAFESHRGCLYVGFKPAIPAGFFCSGAIPVQMVYQRMEKIDIVGNSSLINGTGEKLYYHMYGVDTTCFHFVSAGCLIYHP